MKKISLLPNVITAFSLSCGLFIIFKMCLTPFGEISPSLLIQTAGILLLAAFADLLDGAFARAMKVESEFGGFFDSMSDGITFGVAPTVIVLKSLEIPFGGENSFLLTTGAIVYAVCGVLRLVRYNVHAQLAKSDDLLILANKKNFTGLPIPAACAALVSANLMLITFFAAPLEESTRSFSIFAVMVVLGYFMISKWKFPSVKTLHVEVASFQTVFLTVIVAVLILYGLLNHFVLVFFALSWGYIAFAAILPLIRFLPVSKAPEEKEDDKG